MTAQKACAQSQMIWLRPSLVRVGPQMGCPTYARWEYVLRGVCQEDTLEIRNVRLKMTVDLASKVTTADWYTIMYPTGRFRCASIVDWQPWTGQFEWKETGSTLSRSRANKTVGVFTGMDSSICVESMPWITGMIYQFEQTYMETFAVRQWVQPQW